MNEQATELPYIEDILAETKTRRADWLVGAREINTYLTGLPLGRGQKLAPEILARCIKVVNATGGATSHAWALRKSDADHYQQQGEKQAEQDTKSTNGHKAAEVVILKEGSPILSKQDGENIMRALWDVKLAVQTLTKTIEASTAAIAKMTEALK